MLNVTIIDFKPSHSEQYFRVDKHVSSVLFQVIPKTFVYAAFISSLNATNKTVYCH